MAPAARLDRRLLVRAQHELVSSQPPSTETSLVEVQHNARLRCEARVAREDPGPVAPGAERIASEPAADRRCADRWRRALGDGLCRDGRERVTAQWHRT